MFQKYLLFRDLCNRQMKLNLDHIIINYLLVIIYYIALY